jgi:hypothetical protein
MELVQRILSKVVGEEISVEEMTQVSGGAQDICEKMGGYGTVIDGSDGGAAHGYCDFD